jgi:hypothetical protein
MSILGMPRASSFVDIDRERGRLHVKAGVWFDEELPLGDIVAVRPSAWPWYGGYGVKLGPGGGTVSVVGARDGIVEVTFAHAHTMRVLLNVRRTKLRLSLEEPEEFMRALRDEARAKNDASSTPSL